MEPTQVPDSVRHLLVFHIERIRSTNAEISRLRQFEKTLGSPGRYEWEYRTGTCPNPEDSLAFFETFETLARQNGVDPQSVYQDYGGKPEPEPWSLEALEWVRPGDLC
ncbi:MAG: hypothetical protein ETSY1_46820 (plasmid) [Candidatus Entotheonella factor]|uniref:Uncharacterized protein n=1 Tax=Entotheonella factor TaxID=1429438 RepID=W4M0B0_ENTF1|nr:MAG: hypothetical protein ETSY1_46820 [Candidatus Entotheonella factor]